MQHSGADGTRAVEAAYSDDVHFLFGTNDEGLRPAVQRIGPASTILVTVITM
jgi:hypothetical protein